MAQIAAGTLRYAVKDAGGNYKAIGPSIKYDIGDNTATPRWIMSDAHLGTPQGTPDDQILTTPPRLVADGTRGEQLVVEFFDPTARTIDTSAFTVDLNVADAYRDEAGRVQVVDKSLVLADRVTVSTSGTRNDPNGHNDDTGTVAAKWSPILVFIPPHGHRYAPRGYQRLLVDGS